MSLFSIVVPVYNTEKYLLDCLNSISNQSFNDFEVIVINDGSTDGCQAIIDKYTKSDSRFKCINQENCGLSAARNTGFSNSKGTWVLFLDSDDLLLYNALETLKFIVNTSSYDIVHFNLESFIKEIPKIRTNEEIKTLEIKSRKAIFTLPPMTVVNLYSRDFLIMAKLCFPPSLDAYRKLLADCIIKLDYLGTRLHAGIYALKHKRRSLIIAIDNRAEEMGRDFNIPLVTREAMETLESIIKVSRVIDIQLPHENIKRWKEQFV